MSTTLRQPTLTTLGLGGVLDLFRAGALPVSAATLVDEVFGPAPERGALVISGAGGIVGSGKAMQLGARLQPHGVPLVALDLPGAPDGIGKHYRGLVRAFGRERADAIVQNIVRLAYDGARLPAELDRFRPRFLLEAIPEILELKRAHYALFRERYAEIEIRSVTSGFPSSELGVSIAHPAFPHEINKVWEVVEPEPSPITQLFWALGMIPLPVGDHWSFVLDVLFCGVTLAALRAHDATNMPFWKLDKHVRRLLGPNPFRAHDAIGARGADFLTWSCLHHLAERYGELFRPTPTLVERKDSGQNWYPPEHFRPIVDWSLHERDEELLGTWLLGPLLQMGTLLLREERSHPAHVNIIGELCAQFRSGVLALMRQMGAERVIATVEAYHELHPASAAGPWFPDVLERFETPELRQLYVNAEHDGTVGVVTLGREAYNHDVDAELNRALDWLRAEGIERVILSGDFHLATQLVGADTSCFFRALEDEQAGYDVSHDWSRTARRLYEEFAVAVGFVHGKRCLGGMLELMAHCNYLVAEAGVQLGFPEVTLPVVPGMEGCHWPLRRTDAEGRRRLLTMLLSGRPVRAADAVGWLVDAAAPLEQALALAWGLASGTAEGVPQRPLRQEPLTERIEPPELPAADASTEAARRAILECARDACSVALAEAIERQARHSAAFMRSDACRSGRVGAEARRVLSV